MLLHTLSINLNVGIPDERTECIVLGRCCMLLHKISINLNVGIPDDLFIFIFYLFIFA